MLMGQPKAFRQAVNTPETALTTSVSSSFVHFTISAAPPSGLP